jgi:hypothetical protein
VNNISRKVSIPAIVNACLACVFGVLEGVGVGTPEALKDPQFAIGLATIIQAVVGWFVTDPRRVG